MTIKKKTRVCQTSRDVELMTKFAAGRLRLSVTETFAQHIEHCPDCQKRLEEVCELLDKLPDPLIEDLRRYFPDISDGSQEDTVQD